MITRRLLPLEEIERLREAGGPLAELPDDLLEKAGERGTIAVVEVDGRIVAYWVVFYALHAEPLWVAESARKHPGVLRALMEETRDVIATTGEPTTFAIIGQADLDLHGIAPDRLGFARVPGDLYYLHIDPVVDPPEKV